MVLLEGGLFGQHALLPAGAEEVVWILMSSGSVVKGLQSGCGRLQYTSHQLVTTQYISAARM